MKQLPMFVSVGVNPKINISNILEVALQFLPFEEMEVLDELQKLMAQSDENEINKDFRE